ncbi:MAG: 16S rRNA (cytosine(1402)-N(4))-methyltransferase RsmH [Magnetococcales bacterium]|nr:16S rRNA (cytosine(1402)-N(4))-methyltransferase RsmH [Magnetococcales bacterium]
MSNGHNSVLLHETIAALRPVPGGVYLDATFGDGGHALGLLRASVPGGRVVALDRDPEAVARGQRLAEATEGGLTVRQARFGTLKNLLAEERLAGRVDGFVFDVGVSSRQLDTPERGFSFRLDGPLDMRMDQAGAAPTAADLVNRMPAEGLEELFGRFGEERFARRAARAIADRRRASPFTTTRDLATLLERVIPGDGRIHPATRIFQALRIAVNEELAELSNGLAAAMEAMAPEGRIAVITFHSLEDRIVKQTFRKAALPPPTPTGPAAWLPVSREPFRPRFALDPARPILPGEEEIRRNPRARSAKLRVLRALAPEPKPMDRTA